ncbi:MAG TPA: aminotransferase class I/II-fold pyridoxal phosphate-dependent enzyme, partial [Firmicutes bacterium]|nr:aminotransferase class I/II-fold pyridoxal phosphate-dependent enzyme [Bacillota bacterium]
RADLAEQVARLMTNSNSCTAAATQMAAITALQGPQQPSQDMVEEFRRRRDRIVAGLNDIPGVKCCLPRGSFYVFPNVRAVGDSRRLAKYLLEEAGVATLSGTAFGRYGDGYLRLSYANSLENIERALERMDAAVRRFPG